MVSTRPVRPTAYEEYLKQHGDQPAKGPPEQQVLAEGAPASVHAELAARTEAIGSDLVDLSHEIHARPELCFAEHFAAAAAAQVVRAHGRHIDVGVYDLETSFLAEAGNGRPRVAILAEYDALPGIGHGCGHNVICASAVGAFLAVAPLLDGLGGSVVLVGTPAEEGGCGKELIARAGGFDDVDAAMMVHPAGSNVAECVFLGLRQVDVEYFGLAAHAAAMPFLGRNALDAVVTAYNSISQLRQHILPTDRIHGVITDGGEKPNIIPEHAAASFFLRSLTIEILEELAKRVEATFEAAARVTATGVEIHWDTNPVFLPVRNNRPLAMRYVANLADRGRQVLQADPVPWGSTDMGNVSVRLPSIHPKIAIAPPTTPLHSKEFAKWAISDLADRAVIDGAIGLARTTADFLTDERLRTIAREAFNAAGGVVDVAALDRRPTVP